MSYRLRRSESVAEGVKRVAGEQLDRAMADIENETLNRHEAVHQVRKRFKKIRGLIRLVRPAFEKTYRLENAQFRDAGRELSPLRDAQSLIEGFDGLLTREQPANGKECFSDIRDYLVARRETIANELLDVTSILTELRETIAEAKDRTADWDFKARGFEAIGGGFEANYQKAQAAMQHADRKKATAEDFHEWRKRVKYHWYHCRLLENLWKPLIKARCTESKHLAELLGADHDISLLDQLLNENADQFSEKAELERFQQLLEQSQEKLRRQAFQLGCRLFAEKPKHLVKRFECFWTTWRDAA